MYPIIRVKTLVIFQDKYLKFIPKYNHKKLRLSIHIICLRRSWWIHRWWWIEVEIGLCNPWNRRPLDIKIRLYIVWAKSILRLLYILMRDGAAWLACETHNLEVVSSNLTPASILIGDWCNDSITSSNLVRQGLNPWLPAKFKKSTN